MQRVESIQYQQKYWFCLAILCFQTLFLYYSYVVYNNSWQQKSSQYKRLLTAKIIQTYFEYANESIVCHVPAFSFLFHNESKSEGACFLDSFSYGIQINKNISTQGVTKSIHMIRIGADELPY